MTDGYKKHFDKVKKTSQVASEFQGLRVSEAYAKEMKNQKKSAKKEIQWKTPALAFLGILVLTVGLYSIDDIIKYLERIEVSFLATSQAETPVVENKSAKAAEPNENTPVMKNRVLELEEQKIDHLTYINDRIVLLDEKEKELSKMEQELEVQRQNLDEKIKELQSLRDSISAQLKDKVEVDSQKIDGLVQMYTSMKAPQAAKVFEAMDEDLAVEILGRMKRKPAADVMNLLKPEKAKIISEKQAGYKRR